MFFFFGGVISQQLQGLICHNTYAELQDFIYVRDDSTALMGVCICVYVCIHSNMHVCVCICIMVDLGE